MNEGKKGVQFGENLIIDDNILDMKEPGEFDLNEGEPDYPLEYLET